MDGDYSITTNQGNVDISIINEGGQTLSRDLICVITESDLYYNAPNGLQMHHFVQRDMLPTNTGTPVTVAPGDTQIVNLSFTINSSWVESNIEIVCFLQHDSLHSDSVKEVHQGAKLTLLSLGVEENNLPINVVNFDAVISNTNNIFNIMLSLNNEDIVSLDVYDLTGRNIMTHNFGFLSKGEHSFDLNINDLKGTYFFVIKNGNESLTKKLNII